MKSLMKYVSGTVLIVALIFSAWVVQGQEMPFGGKEDVAFAEKLWQAIDGYTDWEIQTDFYPGRSPHGKFLRTYYSMVNIDKKPYHVIIKDNYAGEDITQDSLAKEPESFLVAVTVMVQREAGYDPDHHNWYWVKYGKDGSVEKNQKGLALAGRVAKGMDQGCIACHASAKGGDYFFTNDQ